MPGIRLRTVSFRGRALRRCSARAAVDTGRGRTKGTQRRAKPRSAPELFFGEKERVTPTGPGKGTPELGRRHCPEIQRINIPLEVINSRNQKIRFKRLFG